MFLLSPPFTLLVLQAQAKQERAAEDRERRLNEAAAEKERAAVELRERTASSETHMLQMGLLQAEVDKLKQQVWAWVPLRWNC